MIFMVLVGGLGTFEGPIIGAVVLFSSRPTFGQRRLVLHRARRGRDRLRAVPAARDLGSLFSERFHVQLLPVGYRLRSGD